MTKLKSSALADAIALEATKKKPSPASLTRLYKEEAAQARTHLDLSLRRLQVLDLTRSQWLASLARWEPVVVRRPILGDMGAFHRVIRVSTTGNFLLTNDCWYTADGTQSSDQPLERLTWIEPLEGTALGRIWVKQATQLQRSLYTCALHRHTNEALSLLLMATSDDITKVLGEKQKRDSASWLWLQQLLWSKPELEPKAWSVAWGLLQAMGRKDLRELCLTLSPEGLVKANNLKDRESCLDYLGQFFNHDDNN